MYEKSEIMYEDLFVETSVFMSHVNRAHPYFKQADVIFKTQPFYTCNLVQGELQHIAEVRDRAYVLIVGDEMEKFNRLKDMREAVLSNFKNSKNIVSYIKEFFQALANDLGIEQDEKYDSSFFDEIKSHAHILIRPQRVRLKAILQNFSEPDYRRKHLIFVEFHYPEYAIIEKSLMSNISTHNEDFMDIKIIANCIYSAYYHNRSYSFVSGDNFFSRNEKIFHKIMMQKFHQSEENIGERIMPEW